MLVTGHLGNGKTEDLTDQVRYETVNPELVRISPTGRVEAVATGETALLVRAPVSWPIPGSESSPTRWPQSLRRPRQPH